MGTISPLDDNLTIGNYEIIEKLGGWSSGSVYRGLDPELGRAVVIRVLRETISWTPGLEERFRRDYAAAAGLKHPNIVAVCEIGKEGTFPYIAMESLGPKNVKILVEQRAELSVETKLSLLIQAATGLSHAHQNGILHLDLTPSKIHITPGDVVKVRNFNLTNLLAQYPPIPEVTRPSVYAAPETAGGNGGTEHSDIYSLGAIFYEFFTFLRPSRSASGGMQFPDFEQVAEIPPGLWIILKTCLAQEPKDRYHSMDDLATAVKDLLDSLAEDKRLMQAELYAAIEPLRRFASSSKVSPEGTLAAHRLLNEIQQLSNGTSESHYAHLDRLMNTLLAQYPLIRDSVDVSEIEIVVPQDEPQSETTSTVQQITSSSVEMSAETTTASQEETISTYPVPSVPEADGAEIENNSQFKGFNITTSDEMETTSEVLSTSSGNPVEVEAEVLSEIQKSDTTTPTIGPENEEDISTMQDRVSVDMESSGVEKTPVSSSPVTPPANTAGSGTIFDSLNVADSEANYSNLNQLMDELLQSNPKLQDIDNSVDLGTYTPPWATPPVAMSTTEPASETPAATVINSPEETPATTSALNKNEISVHDQQKSSPANIEIKPSPFEIPMGATPIPTDLKVGSSLSFDGNPAIPAKVQDQFGMPPEMGGSLLQSTAHVLDKATGEKTSSVNSENGGVSATNLQDQRQIIADKEQQNREEMSSSYAASPDPERRRTPRMETPSEIIVSDESSRKSLISFKHVLQLTAVLILIVGIGFMFKPGNSESEKHEEFQKVEVTVPTVKPQETTFDMAFFEEPEKEEVAEVVQTQEKQLLDNEGRKQVARVEGIITAGNLQLAKTELNKLRQRYPDAPELNRIRRQIQSAEQQANAKAKERAATEQLQSQRRQREDDLNRQVTALLVRGQYAQAGDVMTVWLGENPSSPQAQEFSARIDSIRRNRRAYDAAMTEHRYTEAAEILKNLERLNPNDQTLAALRQQIESRRSSARANLTIYRLSGKGNLQMDGQAVGRNGELEGGSIPIGKHTISVEDNGKIVASQNIDFFEGQRLTLVYDTKKPILRPMSESDRDTLSRRRLLEQGINFDTEHQHGALRGSCRGTLVVTDSNVTFKPFSGDHTFSISAERVRVGKIDGKTMELLDASNNQKLNAFKFETDQLIQQFRKTLEEVHAMK